VLWELYSAYVYGVWSFGDCAQSTRSGSEEGMVQVSLYDCVAAPDGADIIFRHD
jgi:hypothetical protein